MSEEVSEPRPSQALSRNNFEILAKVLSQQLSPRFLACALSVQRHTAQLADYAHKHPYLFATQLLGATGLTTALITVPILGAMGFSSIGPVAGSAAAAWQASMGLVEAGGLFAFCQSAAMGGAAVGTIVMTGALGGVAVVAPTIHQVGERLAVVGDLAAPVIQGAGARMADLGNIVKSKWSGLWH